MSLRSSLFALMYDRMTRKSEEAGMGAMREELLAGAGGRVLEIGGGTGANLRFYGDEVESLVVTEPEAAMLRRLRRKAVDEASHAEITQASAEGLPFADASFDTVVSTLVLCGVDDQVQAVREIRRVLKPGGRLLFLEHVRSGDPDLARFQDRINWLNRLMVDCDCNRPTLTTIKAEQFTIESLEHAEMPKAPKFVRPAIVGSAVAPG
ncbi:MAG TPA: class I SAM-dependent methyltransferase [Gaiellaceae bacterium]|jgi:ubiquinone/menaquinone biosynthesis C-methylase UbiE|nr:class I SAM-dependent methyltransferase [Gaiellaceae bacterium]